MRDSLTAGVRFDLAAVLAVVCLAGCGAGSQTPAASESPPAPATVTALTPYYGSYSTDDQDTVVIARLGWFFDLRDATYRTIYATSSPDRFTIGPAFEQSLPKFADLVFGAGTLTITKNAVNRTARHIDYRQSDVTIPAHEAQLAATITEPLGSGAHAGIVIIHGSEPGQRFFYDIWVGVYTSLGLAVMTYDKRGQGSSTGTYPGEFPTEAALAIYADDAAAALSFLAHRPGLDPKRVGLHGGSQGGWTVPLSMQRHPGVAAFAVLVSAPATTVDQADQWSGFSSGGEVAPSQSTEQMLAAVRATHSGYDPAPALGAMTAPALWLLGTNDRTVPTAICVEILESLHKPNMTVRMLPTGHGLLVNPTGMRADDARSPGLAPLLVPTLKDWIGGHVA